VIKKSTPREIALKTSPILAVLSGIATFILLQTLDALHLWALALLAGLLTETASFLVIEWSVKTFISGRVKVLSEAISTVDDEGHPRDERESLDDIIEWANSQVNDIKSLPIDYKDVDLLKKFITERGKILPRRLTGLTAKQQRDLTNAVKRARIVALLPFVNPEG
jgi:small subunit ribosomal protein S18